MKILITGAAGAIGSHVAEAFARAGNQTIGVDCYTDYYSQELKIMNAQAAKDAGVYMLRHDLAEDDLTELVEGCTAIFHFAAQPGISDRVSFQTYLRNNLIATQRLLDAAHCNERFQGLFVYISTSSVYGKRADVDETALPMPTSAYGVTKLAAEQLALSYARDKGMQVSVLRLFSVYGERERPDKLYRRVLGHVLEGQPFSLHKGSELHRRSYTHVSDIAGVCVVLLGVDRVAVNGQIFNIGNDQTITTGEGLALIEKITGKQIHATRLPPRSGDQEITAANIDKARKILGYEPKVMPEEGLRRMVEWYKESFLR
jgi:nucleoside-diphosphate-sugar epimerase